eukprot:3847687-Rhodomonas_salina.1
MPKKSTGLPVHRSYRPDAQEKEKEKDKKKKKKKKKVQINEEERDEEPDEREQEAEFSFNDLDDGEHERNVDPNDPPLPVSLSSLYCFLSFCCFQISTATGVSNSGVWIREH